jgi:hypothetical protein
MAKKRRQFSSMTEIEEFWRKTGSAGGKIRAKKLSQKQRSEIARKAARTRWAKKKAAAASAKVRRAKARAARKGK